MLLLFSSFVLSSSGQFDLELVDYGLYATVDTGRNLLRKVAVPAGLFEWQAVYVLQGLAAIHRASFYGAKVEQRRGMEPRSSSDSVLYVRGS